MSDHILTLEDLLRAGPPATPRHETREASAPEEEVHIPVAGTDAPPVEVPVVSENTFFAAPAVDPVSDPEPEPEPEPEYPGEVKDAVQVPGDEAAVARKGFDIPTADTAPTSSFPISTSPAPAYSFLGGDKGKTFEEMFDPSRRPPEDSSSTVVPGKQEAGTPAPVYADTQSSDQEPREGKDRDYAEPVAGIDISSPEFEQAVVEVIDKEFPAMPEPHVGIASLGLVVFPPIGAYALGSSVLSLRAAYSGNEEDAAKLSASARNAGTAAILVGVLMWVAVLFSVFYFREDLSTWVRAVL